MPDYEFLKLDVQDRIATVTLDRPPVNAMSMAFFEEIGDVFEYVSGELTDVNVVVFTGTGKYFSAGRDVKTALNDPPEKRSRAARRAYGALLHCAVPVIGAINGPAVGAGFTLALDCDMLVASETATFGLPEINMALSGGMALTRRGLNQYQGRKLYFTGDYVPAEELYRLGVVDRCVPSERLMPEALVLANKLAAKSPLALRAAKWSANEVEKILDFEQAYRAVESRVSLMLAQSEDHQEAVRAFVDKRPPFFTGR